MLRLSQPPALTKRTRPKSISPVMDQTSVIYDQSRRKRNKNKPSSPQPPSQSSVQKWRSEKHQQISSTNIIQSLKELRISSAAKSPSSTSPRGGGGVAVRDAAYRSLAVMARRRGS
ncbi:PREDICTED: transcription factor bHLH147-like [Camelina sativa]|uniref:Transcription factor bHLH147-like n=1 Tax=Camelina sativa TaxID=90675 RepID=A0ABM0TT03_CAMSA|nr:PREDICTED: transcription factor bHLH147-like [Camelina sativa]